MGQTLSEPVTEKHSESGADDRHAYAVSEMQGWRVSMEDAHTTLLKLDPSSTNAFFAVFDGHGGSSVAKYSGQHVAERLAQEEAYKGGDYLTAMRRAFLGTDEDLRADPAFYNDPSGCTAVAALITHDRKLYVANAGDSRSVLSVKGEVKPMSFDHKPTNQEETSRIVAAGGFVEFGRVNGNLALSRAIGDFEFKNNHGLPAEKQIVTANPDIEVHEMTDEDEFLILACDGIWDCVTSQQCVDIVRRQIAQKKPLQEICEFTIQKCCAPDADTGAGIGCDNMTMIVVALLNGKTMDQWYDWMVERVQKNHGYSTPEDLPQVFPESRILAAAQRAQYRNSGSGGFGNGGNITLRGPGGFGALARVLGAGGITFNPAPRGGGDGVLTLGHDEDDDDYEDASDDEGGDTGEGGMFGVNRLRVAAGEKLGDESKANTIRRGIEELEKDLEGDEMDFAHEHDLDTSKGLNKIPGEGLSEGEEERKGDALPRANISLPSPSEKQGMIDLDMVQDSSTPSSTTLSPGTNESGVFKPNEAGFASNGKSWIKVSSPAPGVGITAIGSPLVPIPPSLKDFNKPGEKGRETPPPPASGVKKEGAIEEDKVPSQETGRVPDGDATATPGAGLTNGLLDKSESVV